jgi:hypothetical protein
MLPQRSAMSRGYGEAESGMEYLRSNRWQSTRRRLQRGIRQRFPPVVDIRFRDPAPRCRQSRVSADPRLGLDPVRLGREVADCEVLIDARHGECLSSERGLKLDEGHGAWPRIPLSIHQAIVCLQP